MKKKVIRISSEGWMDQEELDALPEGTKIEVLWPGIDPKADKSRQQCILQRKDGKPCAVFPDGTFSGYLTYVGRFEKLHTRVRLAPDPTPSSSSSD